MGGGADPWLGFCRMHSHRARFPSREPILQSDRSRGRRLGRSYRLGRWSTQDAHQTKGGACWEARKLATTHTTPTTLNAFMFRMHLRIPFLIGHRIPAATRIREHQSPNSCRENDDKPPHIVGTRSDLPHIRRILNPQSKNTRPSEKHIASIMKNAEKRTDELCCGDLNPPFPAFPSCLATL